jgi:hypothetical protein
MEHARRVACTSSRLLVGRVRPGGSILVAGRWYWVLNMLKKCNWARGLLGLARAAKGLFGSHSNSEILDSTR